MWRTAPESESALDKFIDGFPWPYHLLLNLTHEQKHQRRILLDRYGAYAQLSALVPILVFQLYRLGVWVSSERRRAKVDYAAIPTSPGLKHERSSPTAAIFNKWRRTVWWLNEEVARGRGSKLHWLAGLTWTTWLLFLCIYQTGDDYLHITKRFGIVAASQFPLHYMLSLKSVHSLLALAFHTSHEQLNTWHRILGRVIYFLLFSHTLWYLNFFVQANVLYKRLLDSEVIIGIIAFTFLSILVTTALPIIRRWSYRVFFVLHLLIGVAILPLLWFHVSHLRIYLGEALALFFFDIICRKLDTTTGFATITSIPHTKLLKVKIPVPKSKLSRFQAAPGQHVYLSLPPESTPPHTGTPSIHDLLFNPFTVADVSATDITLVLRSLYGPTTLAIDNLAHLTKAKPPINIEGPLGSARNFPNFAVDYDRILLVAGGVGATFILPIYNHIREQLESESKSHEHVKLIWSMRTPDEAAWGLNSAENYQNDGAAQLFFTGAHPGESPEAVDGSVEMHDLHRGGRADRPDLWKIVDEVFRLGSEETVAVLVCGPDGMARDLRAAVGDWVKKGRNVWFHDESFGW